MLHAPCSMLKGSLSLNMHTQLFKITTGVFLITLTACCLAYECDYGSGDLTFRLMRDGKNALYGPDAFLTKADVHQIFLHGPMNEEGYIVFDDSLQTIEFYASTEQNAILQIENITSDTISITSELVSKQRCCDEYQITGVLRNGEVICEGLCEGIIEIEI